MNRNLLLLLFILLLGCQNMKKGTQTSAPNQPYAGLFQRPQTPIMGWSSWNNFHVNIDENIIKAQADFMVSTGMKDAGYSYINIDDGFFWRKRSGWKYYSAPDKIS